MECQAVVISLSDYLDGRNLWMSDDEVEQIETHLTNCPTCRNLKLEFSEIKNAACELPMHTPAPALWTRISKAIESEISTGDGPAGHEIQRSSGWWNRLNSLKFTFSLPQLAAIGALILMLILGKVSGIFGANPTTLNLKGAQSALLLPEEDEINAEIKRRKEEVDARKAHWDSRRRAEFDERMNRIDESLKYCRDKLEGDPKDADKQDRVRALYDEKRQLLEDVERLKW